MHNFSKLSWGIWKFCFHSSETFWQAQKLSHHELVCRCQSKISCNLFCFFFVVFTLLKSWEKSATMYKSQYKLFKQHATSAAPVFPTHTFWKKYSNHSLDLFKRSIESWILDMFSVFTCKNQNCTENQSI